MGAPTSRQYGKLVYENNGTTTVVIHMDIWANLQRQKSMMILMGYDKNKLKIKYIT